MMGKAIKIFLKQNMLRMPFELFEMIFHIEFDQNIPRLLILSKNSPMPKYLVATSKVTAIVTNKIPKTFHYSYLHSTFIIKIVADGNI